MKKKHGGVPSVNPKPELATNRPGETMAEALRSFIYHAPGERAQLRIDIATAYFNLGGYLLIADALDQMPLTRLLLGAEPKSSEPERRRRALKSESVNPTRVFQARLKAVLTDHDHALAVDRDLLGFTRQVDAETRRLLDWLESGRVEVRRLGDRFLHGKAFIASAVGHGVLAGSSNLTRAGLTTNVELNLGNYSPYVVRSVQEWFDELWDAAKQFDLAQLFEARFQPHSPYLIYLRMLSELYGEEIREESHDLGSESIHLTSFQNDGLWRAKRILDEHGGVLIADEVGLGKTFLAGALIEEATLGRRQKVLVVAPAALRDGPWRAFVKQFNLSATIVSYDELTADPLLNPQIDQVGQRGIGQDPNEFAMVVVDEAHNLRNSSTKRAAAMRALLSGPYAKKLILLTATPVNNSLWDLYHLLGYFIRNDGMLADAGIFSLKRRFADAMALDPDELTPQHLFDVLDAVAVRRTRSFVKEYYQNDRIVIGRGKNRREQQIVFPTPRIRRLNYDLDSAFADGFFSRFEAALDPESDLIGKPEGAHQLENGDPDSSAFPALTLARYTPSRYRSIRGHDANQESVQYEFQNAGLLKSTLLKRFESSPQAFARTCRRMIRSHDAFLEILERGQVASGAALADWPSTDSDDDDLELFLFEHGDNLLDASQFDHYRLASDVANDRELLRSLADEVGAITPARDPNLEALVERLGQIAAEAARQGICDSDTRNKRKVIVFSYFADTVSWIADHLQSASAHDSRLAEFRGRIVALTGGSGSRATEDALFGFAPNSSQAPEGRDDDRYDLLICTDILAEGVNLQQARHVINYDLPWNPMRLVQRHGRIDRLASPHPEVFIHCVFPDRRLDDLLGLEERIRVKLKQAANSVGVGEVLPGQLRSEGFITDTRDEIQRINANDAALFERGGTKRGALSGEEFRQELRKAMQNSHLAAEIEALPWGSGSGMSLLPRGADAEFIDYVFCARVADWKRSQFRCIRVPSLDSAVPVNSETLYCLDIARPRLQADTRRELADSTADAVFDAWKRAQADIVEKWNLAADPANLQQPVAKPLRDAAEVLRNHPPPNMSQSEIDRALDSIQAPYPPRTVTQFRQTLAAANDPRLAARQVVELAAELGLQPYRPPDPLPEITSDDVNLVCWLAVARTS